MVNFTYMKYFHYKKENIKEINKYQALADLTEKNVASFGHQVYMCAMEGKHREDCFLAGRPRNISQSMPKPLNSPIFSKKPSSNCLLGMVPGFC